MKNIEESKNKIKRQIELLGLSLSNNYSKQDLIEFLKYSGSTLKRDLCDLRSEAVDIHSSKNKIKITDNNINQERILFFLKSYLLYTYAENESDKSVHSLVANFGKQALINTVLLQKSIESGLKVEIGYRLSDKLSISIRLAPLRFFLADGEWRLLAVDIDTVKQYLLSKIISVRNIGIPFQKRDYDFYNDFLKFSFNCWLNDKRYDVELKVSEPLYLKLTNRFPDAMEKQKKPVGKDNNIKLTVNSLDEIAEWIAGKGSDVKVIKPPELKVKVISLAKKTLKNYK